MFVGESNIDMADTKSRVDQGPNAMRLIKILLLLSVAVSAAACAGTPPSDSRIVGTWRWIQAGDQEAPFPNYQTFDATGSWASWPTPWGEIQRSNYIFEDGAIRIGEGDTAYVLTGVEIQRDQLTFTGEDNGRSLTMRYVREPEFLEPGWLSPEDLARITPRSAP